MKAVFTAGYSSAFENGTTTLREKGYSCEALQVNLEGLTYLSVRNPRRIMPVKSAKV